MILQYLPFLCSKLFKAPSLLKQMKPIIASKNRTKKKKKYMSRKARRNKMKQENTRKKIEQMLFMINQLKLIIIKFVFIQLVDRMHLLMIFDKLKYFHFKSDYIQTMNEQICTTYSKQEAMNKL